MISILQHAKSAKHVHWNMLHNVEVMERQCQKVPAWHMTVKATFQFEIGHFSNFFKHGNIIPHALTVHCIGVTHKMKFIGQALSFQTVRGMPTCMGVFDTPLKLVLLFGRQQ